MADEITAKAEADALKSQLADLPEELTNALLKEAGSISTMLLERLIAKASGDVVKVRSGQLAESFEGSARRITGGVGIKVGTKDPVVNILEHGATLPARDIKPNKAGALHFLGTANQIFSDVLGNSSSVFARLGTSAGVFAKLVKFPGATIAPHPIVSAVFDESETEVSDRLIGVVEDAVRQADKETS